MGPLKSSFAVICLALVLGSILAAIDRSGVRVLVTENVAQAAPTPDIKRPRADITRPRYQNGSYDGSAQTAATTPELPMRDIVKIRQAAFKLPAYEQPKWVRPPRQKWGERPPPEAKWEKSAPIRASSPKRVYAPQPRQRPLQVASVQPASAIVVGPSPVLEANKAGYAALAGGNEEAALEAFRRSLALDREQPQILQQVGYIEKARGNFDEAQLAFAGAAFRAGWRSVPTPIAREMNQMGRPIRISGYHVWRQDSRNEADVAFGPSLAQSQSGIGLNWRLPINGWPSKRNLSVFGRYLWGYQPGSFQIDSDSQQAGVGLQVAPIAGVNFVTAVERLIGIGSQSRSDWMLRASYSMGDGYAPLEGERNWLHWSTYADVALIDPTDPDLQVSADARFGWGFKPFARNSVSLIPFLGFSGNFQDAGGQSTTLGEGAIGLWTRYWPGDPRLEDPERAIDLRFEYRAKLVGNSASASGLRLTVGLVY